VAQQLSELPPSAVLGEPCKRDTAACVGLAAGIIAKSDPQGTMLVLPADHVISPVERFQDAVRRATKLVQDDPSLIVTFGVPPTYPAESYGYIERGEALAKDNVFKVRIFREKPNAVTAKQYLASGNFYWNSGIFVWNAKTIWDALREFEPEMVEQLDKIVAAYGSAEFSRVFRERFEKIRGKSIDYAVMERYPNVAVIEVSFDWDDVGSWQSLTRLRGTDDQGNTVIGRHLGVNSKGCIVRTNDEHLVVTLGMEDCIVVHTPDATLVARKQDEESVRKVVELLKEKDWTEFL
jgi:mannose-1-phosphate guanylyltransferase